MNQTHDEEPDPMKLDPTDLTVEVVPVDSIEPHPENARVHLSKPVVTESVEEHGQYKPLMVQRSTRFIIAGNGTWEVLVAAGAETVAVIMLDVDDAQAKKILLVDNASSDASTYDEEALADLLAQFAGDLTGTGFTTESASDLARIFDGALTPAQLADEYGDEPDPTAFWPVARIRLSPKVYKPWVQLVADHDGDESAAFVTLMDKANLV